MGKKAQLRDPIRWREVGDASSRAAMRAALEGSNLTREELLLGKVDERGEVLWSGCPRWLSKHPGSWPTIDGILRDTFGPEPSDSSGARDRT